MSSISATSGSNYLTPQQLVQAELQQEVNSDAISSSDQSALSSALNDISSSLQDGSGSSGAGSSSPGDLKSKIDSLIANEVSSGKLTQQQATELQGVFQNAFVGDNSGATGSSVQGVAALSAAGTPGAGGPGTAASGPGVAAGGPSVAAGGPGAGSSGGVHHGHGGHGASAGNASASNSDSSSISSAGQILQQFLQSLQSPSTSTYTASGNAASINDVSASASSFLINYRT